MEDILEGKLSYQHDKSSSESSDSLSLSVSDTSGSSRYHVTEGGPLLTEVLTLSVVVSVSAADPPAPPKMVTNRGIKFLEAKDSQVPETLLCPFRRRIQLLYFIIFFYTGIFDVDDFFTIFKNHFND